jgi:predicted nucleic acid-binding protein
MGSPTCLIDPAAVIVIDTSAVINLTATGCAGEILQALPHRVLAVDTVQTELEEGRRRGRNDANLLYGLVTARLIGIVTLDDVAARTFEDLVVGRAAMTLDDGEAATIAYAARQGAVAIIDERKANRICRERFPALGLGCTVDVFSQPDVERTLGRDKLSRAVVNALQLARMRVLPHHVKWVLSLIGSKEAASCASLPRTARRPEHQRQEV